jgi:4-oxalocrotonate tautomerase
MPHIDIKCFPRELDEQQKAALAADITDVIIRHLNSKDSSISQCALIACANSLASISFDEI